MSWGNPWMLLVLIVPLLAAVKLRRTLRTSSRLTWPGMRRVAISGNRVRRLAPTAPRPIIFILAAIALVVLALARPRWGEHTDESFSHTREVMIALDLSRSMLAEDVAPSRLDHAKHLTEQLLNELNGESVGLIVFSGTAFVQVPLSPDYKIIREFMPSLDTDYMPRGGSDYARMLDAALEGFSEAPDRDRYLVVLSDGESSTTGWEQRLASLAERDIHVVSLGLGTDAGAFVPDLQNGGYIAGGDGEAIHSKLMPATLQALASRTNGKYVNASSLSDQMDVAALLADTVETGRKGLAANAAGSVQTERFQWLLLPAVVCALFSLLLEFRRHAKPRQIRRERAVTAAQASAERMRLAAGLTLIVALGLIPQARAHFDSEAEFEVREVFDSNPAERLRAIAEHLSTLGYDAFDLRLMVEASIRYGIDAQRTGTAVNEGVIRDAIEASLQGERLDSSLADWSYYRAQLTAMIEPDAATTADEKSQAKDAVMDEEDNPPIVTGESTQQFASDSFGEGASAKSDAQLGELSTDDDIDVQRGRKPRPPNSVRTATARPSSSDGGDAEDPILKLTRKRLDEAARRDSPGRLHQLMTSDDAEQNENQFDW